MIWKTIMVCGIFESKHTKTLVQGYVPQTVRQMSEISHPKTVAIAIYSSSASTEQDIVFGTPICVVPNSPTSVLQVKDIDRRASIWDIFT